MLYLFIFIFRSTKKIISITTKICFYNLYINYNHTEIKVWETTNHSLVFIPNVGITDAILRAHAQNDRWSAARSTQPTEPIDFSCSSSAAFVLKQERCSVLCVEVLVVTWRHFYNNCVVFYHKVFYLFTMSVNYECVCRLCLSSRGELLPIFPTTTTDDSESAILASKIKDCVSVQVSKLIN